MIEIPCPLSMAAENSGNDLALIERKRRITFRQLDQLVTCVVNSLRACGTAPGDRVAIVEKNRFEYPVIMLALLRLRAVACLLNSRFPRANLADQARKTGCAYQLALPDTDPESFLPDVPVIEIGSLDQPMATTGRSNTIFDALQPATVLFTSGSSAAPKGVLHSFGNHYYSALGSNRNIPVQPGDRWLLSLPLYHVGGLGILFRCLLGGGAVVIPEPGSDMFSQLGPQQITHLSLVSTQLRRLLQLIRQGCEVPRCLKAVLLGGSAVDKRLLAGAREAGLPIHTTYGLTEMASQVATTSSQDQTAPRVLDYRQVRISDEGEILVRGENLFLGYVRDNKVSRPFDDDGWFATGDCGHLDNEGHLTVTGRRDNMFVSGGENVYPEQIESALCELPGVDEALVVPVDDAEFGQRPVAFVRTLPRPREQERLDQSELANKLEISLPRFMIPVAFFRWPDDYEQIGSKPCRVGFGKLAAKLLSGKH